MTATTSVRTQRPLACTTVPATTVLPGTRSNESGLIDNATRGCECGDPTRSVCYSPEGGAQECNPRPGYTMENGTFIDVAECGDNVGVRAWCGRGGVCVEGVGKSVCQCSYGYTNDTLSNGECVGVVCAEGLELSSSGCHDPCRTGCPPPFSCGLTSNRGTECKCQSKCQDLLQTGDTTSSIFHGSFLAASVSQDLISTRRLLKTLETCLGHHTVEITSVDVTTSLKRSVPQLTYQKVQFLVSTRHPNMAQEVAEVIKKQCEAPFNNQSTFCVLPGGLVVKKDSITVADINPCEEDPCPGEVFLCQPLNNTSGRFKCVCRPGFVKVTLEGAPDFCQDMDECRGNSSICSEDFDCINTPGSFVCRLKPESQEHRGKAEREMAISFGVLFFLTVFITCGLVFLLMKKNRSRRELVPMSTTTGFDNESYLR
nr:fibrillin-1-like [Procambarus clarkii]